MDKVFKIGLLILGAILLGIYWIDVRPNLANGRYQLVMIQGDSAVMDTQRGIHYKVVSSKLVSVNLVTGEIYEINLKVKGLYLLVIVDQECFCPVNDVTEGHPR